MTAKCPLLISWQHKNVKCLACPGTFLSLPSSIYEVIMLHKIMRITCMSFILLFAFGSISYACVGRILYIGSLDTPEEKLMAEFLVLLINERTGTNVKIRYFENQDQMYTALKKESEDERIDIIVEDTADAIKTLDQKRLEDSEKELTLVKEQFDKRDIIWLDPFGYKAVKNGIPSITAPLVRRDVLTNFPLLPLVLKKLSGEISDKVYKQLVDEVRSGNKPKNVAKDYLKKEKII